MDTLIGALRNERISLSVAIIVFLILWKGYLWAGAAFVSRDDFSTLAEEIRINNASQMIRDIKTDIRIAGFQDNSAREVQRLERSLAQARLYKGCLVGRKPNCKHLLSDD